MCMMPADAYMDRIPAIFDDIAESIHQGLIAAGHESQRRTCTSLLTGCAMAADVVTTQVRSGIECHDMIRSNRSVNAT